MSIIYQEKQKTYFILIAVFIIIALFFSILIWRPGLFGFDGDFSQTQKLILLAAVVVDLIMFWSFSQLSIKLSEEVLEIRFGVFKKRFKLSEIKNCFIEEYKKSRYWGYGIRIGLDKSVGYVARDGRGIRLEFFQGRDYFFTTNRPEELLNLLKPKIAGKTG